MMPRVSSIAILIRMSFHPPHFSYMEKLVEIYEWSKKEMEAKKKKKKRKEKNEDKTLVECSCYKHVHIILITTIS